VFEGRRVAIGGLVAAVTLAHLWVGGYLAQSMHLAGSAARETIQRIELAFDRELQQSTAVPPAAAPPVVPAPVATAEAAAPAASAASAPDASERDVAKAEPATEPPAAMLATAPAVPASESAVVQADARETPPPVPATTPVATPASAPMPAVAAAPEAGASAATFEWPPSTRLSYTLTGDFRGPVEGSARVEWLRQGARYQVHLDVAIGPSFAPLVRRRMSSEGELTSQGLKPLRYEEETRVPLAATRRKGVSFEGERIVLQGAKAVPTLPGVQDTASQFVQLTWLFTTQPQQLRTGGSVVVPLALPHRVDRWIYDVMGEEVLDTPAGRISTFYIKPRREQQKAGELTIEAWFAPSLQYLPVRIVIRQDAQTFADLLLQRLPQQAGAGS
jgi:hypothetical protein